MVSEAAKAAAGTLVLTRPTAEPRIAVLVLGCLLPVYDRCIKAIRETWGSFAVDGVDTFYVYGARNSASETLPDTIGVDQLIGRRCPNLGEGEVRVFGDIILAGAADLRADQDDCILRKRLLAFDYLANQRRYDFVYAVCATSYVDLSALKRYVGGVPSSGVYHGPLYVHGPSGFPFVSGASFLLSRDMAAALADNAAQILSTHPATMPDDVVIGHFIASRYCTPSIAAISQRIAAGTAPTDTQTFVAPPGHESVDFVTAPAFEQVPRDGAFHFHFHSRRIWEMENFHRRFFASRARPSS